LTEAVSDPLIRIPIIKEAGKLMVTADSNAKRFAKIYDPAPLEHG
jgi:hypothetical protein